MAGNIGEARVKDLEAVVAADRIDTVAGKQRVAVAAQELGGGEVEGFLGDADRGVPQMMKRPAIGFHARPKSRFAEKR